MVTSKEDKAKIKFHAYMNCYDTERIMRELGVSRRAVAFALREESKEQYQTRYYMKRLQVQKEKIYGLISGFDLDNITTMYILKFIKELNSEVDVLSSREMDVYTEVL